MKLDAAEREELAEGLRQQVRPNELSPEQSAKLNRRADAVDRGEVETIPGEQVSQELRQRFPAR